MHWVIYRSPQEDRTKAEGVYKGRFPRACYSCNILHLISLDYTDFNKVTNLLCYSSKCAGFSVFSTCGVKTGSSDLLGTVRRTALRYLRKELTVSLCK